MKNKCIKTRFQNHARKAEILLNVALCKAGLNVVRIWLVVRFVWDNHFIFPKGHSRLSLLKKQLSKDPFGCAEPLKIRKKTIRTTML